MPVDETLFTKDSTTTRNLHLTKLSRPGSVAVEEATNESSHRKGCFFSFSNDDSCGDSGPAANVDASIRTLSARNRRLWSRRCDKGTDDLRKQ